MGKKFPVVSEKIPYMLLGSISSLVVIILASIFIFLCFTGLKAFEGISLSEFFLGTDWNPSSYRTPSWGILSLISGTLIVSVLALLISVPLGIAIAIYLSEIAHPKIREIIKPGVEMIASIPSVVLGLIGLIYLGPRIGAFFHLSNGLNALTASLLVAVAALPTIASICEDAISGISTHMRQSSLALGATQWETIKHVVIPAAKSGIVAAIMLGLGRVIGETIIVLMVAGNSRAFPISILQPVRPMTATIAIEIKEVVIGSLHWHSLFAIGGLLFLFTFLINIVVDVLISKRASL